MAKRLLLLLMCFCGVCAVQAQIIVRNDSITKFDTDSLRRIFDRGPYFGCYKDNYFVFGTSIGPKPTKQNSNVKFQISIQQRITRSTLPFNTYLYLFYTQRVIWNVLEDSMPMTDMVFNPGIGVARPFFSSSQGRYIGKMIFVIEHESNGKDGDASRSWNRITIGGNILLDKNIMVYGKVWIPIIDGVNNKDILKYCGIYQSGLQLMSDNRRFGAAVTVTKRASWNPFKNNIQLDLKYRCFPADNIYLFMQYYNGYGESLIDYNKHSSELRVGICLSPTFFSEY